MKKLLSAVTMAMWGCSFPADELKHGMRKLPTLALAMWTNERRDVQGIAALYCFYMLRGLPVGPNWIVSCLAFLLAVTSALLIFDLATNAQRHDHDRNYQRLRYNLMPQEFDAVRILALTRSEVLMDEEIRREQVANCELHIMRTRDATWMAPRNVNEN